MHFLPEFLHHFSMDPLIDIRNILLKLPTSNIKVNAKKKYFRKFPKVSPKLIRGPCAYISLRKKCTPAKKKRRV